MTKTTITINGRIYDAITGMPMPEHEKHAPATAPHAKPLRAFSDVGPSLPVHHLQKPQRPPVAVDSHLRPLSQSQPHADRGEHPAAQAVHQSTEKSHTLYRKALKKPQAEFYDESPTPATPPHLTPHHSPVQKSPLVSRFGSAAPQQPQPEGPPSEPEQEPPVTPATVHPAVAKVLQSQLASQQAAAAQPTGTELKEQLIKERLAEVEHAPKDNKKHREHKIARPSRMIAVLSSTLALLVLGGYLTYLTLPSISLRVAASRAGINASMPNYKPDGYSLNGPIAYSPGEVIINYKSNTNADTNYKLTQKATNWDSQAVLDNYVTKATDNYLTFQERGITVYTFNNKAAWVNGGVLYTLDGDARLSSDQILHIATSM